MPRIGDIDCPQQIFDVAFHPTADCLAVAQIDGSVLIYNCAAPGGKAQLMYQNKVHKKSCRGVIFNRSGTALYSISSDKSIQGLDASGNQTFHFKHAHDDPINKIHRCSPDDNIFVTGDDSGVVKVWDARASFGQVLKWRNHSDFVSDLTCSDDGCTILSTGGDSILCTYDIRNPTANTQSDEQESELQCVKLVKNGTKALVGTEDGIMLLFSWGMWGDCTDRVTCLNKKSVDCLEYMNENTVITGSSDGKIRLVSLFPHKVLKILGTHDEFPVEGLKLSPSGNILASYSHDETVRLWNIADAKAIREHQLSTGGSFGGGEEEEEDDDSDEDSDEDSEGAMDEDDDDDDDDESGEMGGGGAPAAPPAKPKTQAQKFFADL